MCGTEAELNPHERKKGESGRGKGKERKGRGMKQDKWRKITKKKTTEETRQMKKSKHET